MGFESAEIQSIFIRTSGCCGKQYFIS